MKNLTRVLYDVFCRKMRRLEEDGRLSVAIALSGGPDSMALAYVTALYFKRNHEQSTDVGEYAPHVGSRQRTSLTETFCHRSSGLGETARGAPLICVV